MLTETKLTPKSEKTTNEANISTHEQLLLLLFKFARKKHDSIHLERKRKKQFDPVVNTPKKFENETIPSLWTDLRLRSPRAGKSYVNRNVVAGFSLSKCSPSLLKHTAGVQIPLVRRTFSKRPVFVTD